MTGSDNTGIAVIATSSQGSASEITAAINIGKAVASDEVRANTATISPDVLTSAAWIAVDIRSRSSSEIVITSSLKPHHRPTIRRRRKNRLHRRSHHCCCETRLN